MNTPPRLALLLDTETTGLDPKVDEIIEIGCILYDLKAAQPVASFSTLAKPLKFTGTSRITGITGLVLEQAFLRERVWVAVGDLLSRSHVVLAHNAKFDRSFLEADESFRDFWHAKPAPGPNELFAGMPPWVCTMDHITWPGRDPGDSKSLASLALHYGVALTGAHRALVDCDILSRTLTRVAELGTDLQVLVASAMVPRQTYQAMVSYAQKDLAKEAGFRWDGKRWTKELTEAEAKNLKFRVVAVK